MFAPLLICLFYLQFSPEGLMDTELDVTSV